MRVVSMPCGACGRVVSSPAVGCPWCILDSADPRSRAYAAMWEHVARDLRARLGDRLWGLFLPAFLAKYDWPQVSVAGAVEAWLRQGEFVAAGDVAHVLVAADPDAAARMVGLRPPRAPVPRRRHQNPHVRLSW